MRRRLVAGLAYVRLHPIRLATGAYAATASVIGCWSLLVMLRASVSSGADSLWVFSFAHDLLHGIPVRGWRLPGAPIYFPELLSVVSSSGLGFSVHTSLLVHGFVSWLLIGAGIHGGLRLGGLGHAQALRFALGTLLVYVLVHCGSSRLAVFQYPFSHGGATLGTFFGLLYIGGGLQRGFGTRGWCCASACLGLLCASDRSILAQFVAPALLVAVVFLALRWVPRRRLVAALGLLLLGPLLGWLSTLLIRGLVGIRPFRVEARFSWDAAGPALSRLFDQLGQLAADAPLVAASVLVPAGLMVWRAHALVLELREARRTGGTEAARVTAECWIACAGLATLLATLGAVVAADVWSQRYILPVLVLPLALAVIVCARRLPRLPGGVTRALELALLALVVLTSKKAESRARRPEDKLYDPRRACFDTYLAEEGLHAGYAEYWHVRPPMVLGHTPVTLAQVRGRLRPRRWADNVFWYTRGYWPSEPRRPHFDFVTVARLDTHWLEQRFGAPRTKHSCFGDQLWVYDRPDDLEFRNYLRSDAARKTGDHDQWWEDARWAGRRERVRSSV